MAGDELRQFEAVLGAIGKLPLGDENASLEDAKCPNCGAASFAKIADVYYESSVRVEAEPESADVKRELGLSDREIVAKFRPPQRKSVVPVIVLTAIPLGAIVFEAHRRFGGNGAFIGALVTVPILAAIALTNMRKKSDQYYYARQKWNKLYRCRKCGQLVAA